MELKEKINPRHTAILVIDIQKDFADPNGVRGARGGDLSQVEPMIDKLEQLVPIAKDAGVLVLYTQQIYDRDKLNNLQKEQYDLDGKLVMCDSTTGGHEFYRINPPKEDVFEKQNFNAFSNPELQKRLDENGIKTLVITGMDTYYCVETAIRNGYDLGYKIVVPQDLVAGNGKHIELHNRTLELVRKTYGVLSSSDELTRIWGV
ncbi:cysteine hydrolase [Candidatus Kaiserbacteria bacterium]|nr:cysteine hydrolase [Candidatus Kaiserbacteria bacterium]MCB9811482.1 cysteine hydrolase [Candidatus Nomurabacteria bacterium]